MSYFAQSWKRWLVWLVVATVFAISCVLLSEWQFDRRAHRVEQIELVKQNYDAPAVELGSFEASVGSKWRPVTLEGRYLVDLQLLVRNRPQNGQPGFETLVPFQTLKGDVFIVSRGWLPTGSKTDSPDRVPMPSIEVQVITARLVAFESKPDRDAPAGQVAGINLAELENKVQVDFRTDWYLRMASEADAPAEMPLPLLKPSTDEGNHLSYALQWLLFGILGFVALYLAINKEYEFYRIQTDPNFVPKRRKATRSERDNEVEDLA